MAIGIGQSDVEFLAAGASTAAKNTAATGSAFVVAVFTDGAGISFTDNKNAFASYSAIGAEFTVGGWSGRARLWLLENGAGGTGHQITPAATGATGFGTCFVEVTGGVTSGLLDQSVAWLTDTSSTYDSNTTGTTAQAAELALAFGDFFSSGGGPSALTWGNGFTEIGEVNNGASITVGCAYKILASTQTVTASLTASGGTPNNADTIVITLREAGSSATPPGPSGIPYEYPWRFSRTPRHARNSLAQTRCNGDAVKAVAEAAFFGAATGNAVASGATVTATASILAGAASGAASASGVTLAGTASLIAGTASAAVDGNASGVTIAASATLTAGAASGTAAAGGATVTAAASLVTGSASGAATATGATLAAGASLLAGAASGVVNGNAAGVTLAASATLIGGNASGAGNATASGATITAGASIVAGTASAESAGNASGATVAAVASIVPGAASGEASVGGVTLSGAVALLPGTASGSGSANAAGATVVAVVTFIAGTAQAANDGAAAGATLAVGAALLAGSASGSAQASGSTVAAAAALVAGTASADGAGAVVPIARHAPEEQHRNRPGALQESARRAPAQATRPAITHSTRPAAIGRRRA